MKLTAYPYGQPYLHRPTGKVIYLSNRVSDGTYQAHYKFREPMIVQESDLDYPLQSEVKRDYPDKN